MVKKVAVLIFSLKTPPYNKTQLQDSPTSSTAGHPGPIILFAFAVATILFMLIFYYYIAYRLRRTTVAQLLQQLGTTPSGQRSPPAGLHPSISRSFPILTYAEVKVLNRINGKAGVAPLECPVCLNAFEGHETLRLLPKCDHVFHRWCVDRWLRSHTTCPCCRANLVPEAPESTHTAVPASAESGGATEEDGGVASDGNALVVAPSRGRDAMVVY
ncbi:hypothetical protein Nepgr_012287 [Nepenthes gracilis]|uniref:RING-type E3 ubiquitin transferase n=1 Tax=Nepenthes gracilis TaxID=150966 RepID=A0AAD3SGP5_NEPGR|nr:hypothetical protein Nepgr_012287 [Nepenthes gracilis]